MSPEEGTGLETSTDTTVVVEGQPPPSIVDAEGKFSEGWRDSLPDDIKNEVCLGTVSDVPSMAKQFVHAQRMIGKDKIAAPNENSSEAEWDAFYVAAGRPDTPGDYNIIKPDDFPEELFSAELATQAQGIFHKLGISKKQAEGLVAFNNAAALAALQSKQIADEQAIKEVENGLNVEWGNAKEQKMHFGNLAVKEGTEGNEEFKERLAAKFGNDPDYIRLMANLGSKFVEHGAVKVPMVPTPSDVDNEIGDIMHSPAYLGGLGISTAEHNAAVQKAYNLRLSKEPKSPTG